MQLICWRLHFIDGEFILSYNLLSSAMYIINPCQLNSTLFHTWSDVWPSQKTPMDKKKEEDWWRDSSSKEFDINSFSIWLFDTCLWINGLILCASRIRRANILGEYNDNTLGHDAKRRRGLERIRERPKGCITPGGWGVNRTLWSGRDIDFQ